MLETKKIVIHEVKKELKNFADIKLRPEENPVNDSAKKVTESMPNLFRDNRIRYGSFDFEEDLADAVKPHFLTLLDKYYKSEEFEDFLTFSHSATEHFKTIINESPAAKASAKGGYLLFDYYVRDSIYFLSIILLRDKIGIIVDDLNFSQMEEIDLEKFHLGARINLSRWKINEDRYIGYSIGDRSKKVTDFFAKFIGCNQYTRAKEDTKQLKNIVAEYCKNHGIVKEMRDKAKSMVHDYCMEKHQNKKPIRLTEISQLLDIGFDIDEDKRDFFINISQEEPFLLHTELEKIDRAEVKLLNRYYGSDKKMVIAFDRNLLGDKVLYENNALIFNEIPDDLKQDLDEYISNEINESEE